MFGDVVERLLGDAIHRHLCLRRQSVLDAGLHLDVDLGFRLAREAIGQTPQQLREIHAPSNTVYRPTVLITVTYTGFSGTFFRYSVPFTVTAS
jgi:hypothetical protein